VIRRPLQHVPQCGGGARALTAAEIVDRAANLSQDPVLLAAGGSGRRDQWGAAHPIVPKAAELFDPLDRCTILLGRDLLGIVGDVGGAVWADPDVEVGSRAQGNQQEGDA
jgi:hypothetical protein